MNGSGADSCNMRVAVRRFQVDVPLIIEIRVILWHPLTRVKYTLHEEGKPGPHIE